MNDELLAALAQYFAQFSEADDEQLRGMLLPILEQAAKDGAAGALSNVEGTDGINVDWSLVNENAVAWAKNYAAQLVTKINGTTRQLLAEAISQHLNTPGATLADLQAKIQDTMKANDIRARMIAQTEITRAYASGNLETWKASGAIEQKRWRTNNDHVVCDQCEPLNGKVVGIGEQFETDNGERLDAPPAHPGCRCWITPVVEVE